MGASPSDSNNMANCVSFPPPANPPPSKAVDRSVETTSSEGHKLGQVLADTSLITQIVHIKSTVGQCVASTTAPLIRRRAAFDEAWLTLKSVGNKTVKPDELARSVLRLAMEGERDPVRLSDGALNGLLPATTWREAS
jgi:hypothetical protein